MQRSNSNMTLQDDLIEMANLPSSLPECTTSVQFVLLALSMSFEVKPKQAAALLTNNHKYLMYISVKGGKGQDFSKVVNWYGIMYPHVAHLVQLILTEKKDVLTYGSPFAPMASPGHAVKENRKNILYKTLNIFKGGLYSKNEDVVQACGMLFIRMISEINDNGGDLVGDAWDWFTTSTYTPEFKRALVNPKYGNASGNNKQEWQQYGKNA